MEEISTNLKAITKKHGGRDFEFAKTEAEAEAAWQGRKAALWSVQALKENGRVWTTDVWSVSVDGLWRCDGPLLMSRLVGSAFPSPRSQRWCRRPRRMLFVGD
jgi:hypothetical protein